MDHAFYVLFPAKMPSQTFTAYPSRHNMNVPISLMASLIPQARSQGLVRKPHMSSGIIQNWCKGWIGGGMHGIQHGADTEIPPCLYSFCPCGSKGIHVHWHDSTHHTAPGLCGYMTGFPYRLMVAPVPDS